MVPLSKVKTSLDTFLDISIFSYRKLFSPRPLLVLAKGPFTVFESSFHLLVGYMSNQLMASAAGGREGMAPPWIFIHGNSK